MKKRDVLEILDSLPDELDIDQFIYTLWLRRKVELALESAPEDDIPHEEVERLSEEWLASLGRPTPHAALMI